MLENSLDLENREVLVHAVSGCKGVYGNIDEVRVILYIYYEGPNKVLCPLYRNGCCEAYESRPKCSNKKD